MDARVNGGGGLSCIIQEKPGGEWRRDGAKRHMQTMPCVSEIQISLVDLSSTVMASNNLFIWTNSQIGALMLSLSVAAISDYNDLRVLNIGSGITVISP